MNILFNSISILWYILLFLCFSFGTTACEGGNKTNTNTQLPTTPTPITADVQKDNKNTAIAIANNGNAEARINNTETTDNSTQAPTSPLP